jgi:hypothetical protein
MVNGFVKWLASLVLLLSVPCNSSSLRAINDSFFQNEDLEDSSLVLSEDEPEHLVSITGKLQLHMRSSDPENEVEGYLIKCWILKLNSESFETACSTPAHGSFQTPDSIRFSQNGDQMELTGDFDQKWLQQHLDQTVTIEGYLWHAHTGHHLTPVMINPKPWFE